MAGHHLASQNGTLGTFEILTPLTIDIYDRDNDGGSSFKTFMVEPPPEMFGSSLESAYWPFFSPHTLE